MWIAFKNYYLRDEGQPAGKVGFPEVRCELLSKIIIFVMKDNSEGNIFVGGKVVNCFQKLLSSWWRTTNGDNPKSIISLWIAFKNYYLRDEGQRSHRTPSNPTRCELLSKIIIFVMKDNAQYLFLILLSVVNCFQKLLSSWWRTTRLYNFSG